MKIITLVVGEIETNCYLLINEDTKEAVIVDPADNAGMIIKTAGKEECTPKAVFLTHGHWDHFLAVKEVASHFNIPVVCEEDEAEVLGDPMLNLTSRHEPGPETIIPDITVKDLEEIQFAGFTFQVLHTAGHTKGSCCYYLKDENVLIAGDTMFRNGYGRVDLPTGNTRCLYNSLKRLCTGLPEDTAVYPGHGPYTTIGYERMAYDFSRNIDSGS